MRANIFLIKIRDKTRERNSSKEKPVGTNDNDNIQIVSLKKKDERKKHFLIEITMKGTSPGGLTDACDLFFAKLSMDRFC